MNNTVHIRETGEELAIIDSPMKHHLAGLSYTRSGYGGKIPTTMKVKYLGKERRIYTTIYSNVGSCFIVVNGANIYVY